MLFALSQLRSRKNFELIQAYLHLFLEVCSDFESNCTLHEFNNNRVSFHSNHDEDHDRDISVPGSRRCGVPGAEAVDAAEGAH